MGNPVTYIPKLNNHNIYVDEIPKFNVGIICDCHTRKDMIYNTHCKFIRHTKSKKHIEWLKSLNNLKRIEYIENLKLKEENEKLKEELEFNKISNKVEVNELTNYIILLLKKIEN